MTPDQLKAKALEAMRAEFDAEVAAGIIDQAFADEQIDKTKEILETAEDETVEPLVSVISLVVSMFADYRKAKQAGDIAGQTKATLEIVLALATLKGFIALAEAQDQEAL